MTNNDWMKPDPDDVADPRVDLHIDRPHPARIYDYLLGGKDNFAADRDAAEAGLLTNPNARVTVRENRAFMRRVVRYLVKEAGIRQFLDVGTGLPTSPNVHEIAQAAAPEARIAYVDNDPIVLVHARALLTSSREGKTSYIDADMRDPASILSSPELQATLDLSQPVALLLIAILHFIPDQDEPYLIVSRLIDALPAGSCLALSHLTSEFDPVVWEGISEVAANGGMNLRVRSLPEIGRFFDGLELVEPGVQAVSRWRPDPGDVPPDDSIVSLGGGLARKS